MRSKRADLTIPQFRTLSFINCHAGVALTEVADHMGLTLPTMSKMVDDLFKKGLLQREEQPADRRRIKLAATPRGVTIMEAARQSALAYLSKELEAVNAQDQAVIVEAMKTLRLVFKVANNPCGAR
jgi:DNA-binding MarR family transcriptional regulator